jgi:hypothetical protein
MGSSEPHVEPARWVVGGLARSTETVVAVSAAFHRDGGYLIGLRRVPPRRRLLDRVEPGPDGTVDRVAELLVALGERSRELGGDLHI